MLGVSPRGGGDRVPACAATWVARQHLRAGFKGVPGCGRFLPAHGRGCDCFRGLAEASGVCGLWRASC